MSATATASATENSAPTSTVADVALVADYSGCATLDEVSAFLGRFIAYPTEYARVAHVLWIAHTYRMDAWDSTPRLAFMSTEKGSGKTRALEVTYHLVSDGHHASNVSNAFILGAIADNPSTTILLDEIDTVYGPRAKGNEDLRSTINSGHRRGGEAGRGSWADGKITATRFSSYCPVALAGLGTLPETVADRSVVVRMKRRRPTDHVEPWRERLNAGEARELAQKLQEWVKATQFYYPDNMPVTDRKADVWEALVMVADAAGGHWPTTTRQAAVAMTSGDHAMSKGVRLLRDLRDIFTDKREMFTADILDALRNLPETPWRDLTDRQLALALGDYEVRSHQIRNGKRGYRARDLEDPWERHLPHTPVQALHPRQALHRRSALVKPVADPIAVAEVTRENLPPAPLRPNPQATQHIHPLRHPTRLRHR